MEYSEKTELTRDFLKYIVKYMDDKQLLEYASFLEERAKMMRLSLDL